MARFINAHLYRAGGISTVNITASAALDEDLQMPTVALHATCAVEALTEPICDYGNKYWPAIKLHLVEMWDKYLHKAHWLHAFMAETMAANGLSSERLPVPLPAHEDESYHWAPDEVQYPVWPLSGDDDGDCTQSSQKKVEPKAAQNQASSALP